MGLCEPGSLIGGLISSMGLGLWVPGFGRAATATKKPGPTNMFN